LVAELEYHFDLNNKIKANKGKVPIYSGNPDLWNPLD